MLTLTDPVAARCNGGDLELFKDLHALQGFALEKTVKQRGARPCAKGLHMLTYQHSD
jgi:hypothetical protein